MVGAPTLLQGRGAEGLVAESLAPSYLQRKTAQGNAQFCKRPEATASSGLVLSYFAFGHLCRRLPVTIVRSDESVTPSRLRSYQLDWPCDRSRIRS